MSSNNDDNGMDCDAEASVSTHTHVSFIDVADLMATVVASAVTENSSFHPASDTGTDQATIPCNPNISPVIMNNGVATGVTSSDTTVGHGNSLTSSLDENCTDYSVVTLNHTIATTAITITTSINEERTKNVAAQSTPPSISTSTDVPETETPTIMLSNSNNSRPRKDFEHRLKELKNYKAKYRDCMVPHKFPENPSLGTWVDTQRRRYRAFLRHRKNNTSAGAEAVIAEFHGMEAQHHQTQDGRSSHNNNNASGASSGTMTQDHVLKLRDLGFVFEPRLTREETWNRRIEELEKYKSEHFHCNVREDDTSNYPGLGKWVSYVRRQFRLQRRRPPPIKAVTGSEGELVVVKGKLTKSSGGKGSKRLSEKRILQLRDMGFVFELKEAQAMRRFREGLGLLKEFYRKEGHVNVPKFYPQNPTFGLCVEEMRKEYRNMCRILYGRRTQAPMLGEGGDAAAAVDCMGHNKHIMKEDIAQELSSMGFLAEEGVTLLLPAPPIEMPST